MWQFLVSGLELGARSHVQNDIYYGLIRSNYQYCFHQFFHQYFSVEKENKLVQKDFFSQLKKSKQILHNIGE